MVVGKEAQLREYHERSERIARPEVIGHRIPRCRVPLVLAGPRNGTWDARALADDLESLRFRCLGPEAVGSTHSARSLRARPPAIVSFAAGPNHERGDFGGVRKRDERLPANEAGRPALCLAVAIQ